MSRWAAMGRSAFGLISPPIAARRRNDSGRGRARPRAEATLHSVSGSQPVSTASVRGCRSRPAACPTSTTAARRNHVGADGILGTDVLRSAMVALRFPPAAAFHPPLDQGAASARMTPMPSWSKPAAERAARSSPKPNSTGKTHRRTRHRKRNVGRECGAAPCASPPRPPRCRNAGHARLGHWARCFPPAS